MYASYQWTDYERVLRVVKRNKTNEKYSPPEHVRTGRDAASVLELLVPRLIRTHGHARGHVASTLAQESKKIRSVSCSLHDTAGNAGHCLPYLRRIADPAPLPSYGETNGLDSASLRGASCVTLRTAPQGMRVEYGAPILDAYTRVWPPRQRPVSLSALLLDDGQQALRTQ